MSKVRRHIPKRINPMASAYLFPMSKSTLFDPTQAGVLRLAEATQFSDAGIVSRALHDQAGVRVTLFAFAAGQQLTEHATPARALVQILSGACEFMLAGKKMPLRAGELLHMPPGLPHAVLATEAFSMLLITIREPKAAAGAA
jgi:quercetin dioxygenase-like cupin family protein